MKKIGTFKSKQWGTVVVLQAQYGGAGVIGPAAVILESEAGEPLATLSVNMGDDTRDLPPNTFYMKDWSENAEIAQEASESGLFKLREDLPVSQSGYVFAEAWEIAS